ncbi:hypothetical protein ABZ864_23995 [Streptomyces sp. NPDC047082]|uniref:hypothetical protein n=1 Tax=Streptomyces sp. NPDC047082 TaxID=3155259 RepID=UPI0033C641A7
MPARAPHAAAAQHPPGCDDLAYVTNARDDTVSVIDTRTNQVIGTPISVGNNPIGVAIVG